MGDITFNALINEPPLLQIIVAAIMLVLMTIFSVLVGVFITSKFARKGALAGAVTVLALLIIFARVLIVLFGGTNGGETNGAASVADISTPTPSPIQTQTPTPSPIPTEAEQPTTPMPTSAPVPTPTSTPTPVEIGLQPTPTIDPTMMPTSTPTDVVSPVTPAPTSVTIPMPTIEPPVFPVFTPASTQFGYATIRFNAGVGSVSPIDSIVQISTEGTIDITFPFERPVRPGYTFMGWTDDGHNEFMPGDSKRWSVVSDQIITYHAMWSDASAFMLHIDFGWMLSHNQVALFELYRVSWDGMRTRIHAQPVIQADFPMFIQVAQMPIWIPGGAVVEFVMTLDGVEVDRQFVAFE